MKENLNVKDNKGSITVFVLIALMFMISFLIISFANNINKSKIAKEQFNIISSIYSHDDGNAKSYERAYTALRKKNKQILTASVENSDIITLDKTFEDKLINYRIYGSSAGVGDKVENLFDVDSVKKKENWKQYPVGESFMYYPLNYLEPGEVYTMTATTKNQTSLIGASLSLNRISFQWNIETENPLPAMIQLTASGAQIGTSSYSFYATGDEILKLYCPKDIYLNNDSTLETIFESDVIDIVIEKGAYSSGINNIGKYKIKMENRLNVIPVTKGKFEHTRVSDTANYRLMKAIPVKKNDKITLLIEFGADNNIGINVTLYSNELGVNNYTKADGTEVNVGANILGSAIKQSGIYTYVMPKDGFISIACGYSFLEKNLSISDRGYLQHKYKSGSKIQSINRISMGFGILTDYDWYPSSDRDTDIYLDEPLLEGEYIDFETKTVYKANGTVKQYNVDIPELQTYEDYGRVQVLTENAPAKIELEYVGYTLE